MVKTDAEGAPTGQELPAELILAYLTSGLGFTYREHPADVGPLLEVADQLQARDKSRMP